MSDSLRYLLPYIGGAMLISLVLFAVAVWQHTRSLPAPEKWQSPYGKFNVDDVRRIEALARRQRQH